MLTEPVDVVIGIDTHKHTHTAAAVTATGAVLEHVTVSTDSRGYRQLLKFGTRHGATLWAIEGTGSYGAGITTMLLTHDEHVVEIESAQRRPRHGGEKSDEIDAVRAARHALAGEGLSEPRARGDREAIRVLLTTRAQAVESRVQAVDALHALIVSAPDVLRERLRRMPIGMLLHTCAALRSSSRQDAETFATTIALRVTARRALACEIEAKALEVQMGFLVQRVAPVLLEEFGVGTVIAAQLIVSWSHQGRLHSEAAFAKLAGVAPIPASSGMNARHRLSRSGDRQLNRALHTIVLARMRQDPETRAYVERRTAQGRNTREIRRCLKRYVARHLFRVLEAMPNTT